MKLIENWDNAYKMISVQAMVLATAVQGAWLALPPELVAIIPSSYVHYITGALMVVGIIGRLIPQESVK